MDIIDHHFTNDALKSSQLSKFSLEFSFASKFTLHLTLKLGQKTLKCYLTFLTFVISA